MTYTIHNWLHYWCKAGFTFDDLSPVKLASLWMIDVLIPCQAGFTIDDLPYQAGFRSGRWPAPPVRSSPPPDGCSTPRRRGPAASTGRGWRIRGWGGREDRPPPPAPARKRSPWCRQRMVHLPEIRFKGLKLWFSMFPCLSLNVNRYFDKLVKKKEKKIQPSMTHITKQVG